MWRDPFKLVCTATLPLLLLAVPAAAAPPLGVNWNFVAPGPETPQGYTVESATLVENATAWDGRVVAFTGEAVGEALVRSDGAWLQLNDDPYQWRNVEEGQSLGGYNSGQAVWTSGELARRVSFFGGYRHEGDVVRVAGEFHAACPKHGGDMDIHAGSLEVVRQGHAVAHRLNIPRLEFALALLALAGTLYFVRRRTEKRRM